MFDGRYKEEYNVLNWIMTVERYLYNCNKGEAVFSSYAYTYLDKEVQVWFDHRFLSTPLPPWEEMTAAMIKRYLPQDHSSRLVRKFAGIRQVGSLMQYVDRFQNLLSALGLAGIQKSSTKCIGQFIDGLKEQEDRKTLLLKKPTTMKECYEIVTQIRGAKIARPEDPQDHGRRNRRDAKRFNRLEGKARIKAKAEGNCLECGESGHWWRQCPHLKPKAYRLEKTKRGGPRKHPKKFHSLETGTPEDQKDSPAEAEEIQEDADEVGDSTVSLYVEAESSSSQDSA